MVSLGILTFVITVEALTFLFFGFLHSGIRLPLGFATLHEPRIIPAMIVESLCGFLLAGSALSIAAYKSWSWEASVTGPRTKLNDIYHRTILILLVVILIYLFTPAGKAVLGREL